MNRANESIKQRAKEAGVSLWQIADAFGVSESTISRWLRHELDATKEAAFNEAIDRILERRK